MKNLSKEKQFYLLLLFLACIGGCLLFFSFKKKPESQQMNMEKEVEAFLSQSEGVGQASVKLFKDENGKISGAAVICDGGDSPVIQAKIIGLLTASLGIKAKDIYISSSG